MRRFRFRLETVLRVRRHREDLAARELAEAEARVGEQREAIAALDQTIAEAQEAFHRVSYNPQTTTEMNAYLQYLDALGHNRTVAEGELQKRMEERDAKLQARIKARQEVRVLERLRERRFQEWLDEMDKHEREMLDDIGGRMHYRPREHGGMVLNLLILLCLLLLMGAAVFLFGTAQGRSLLPEALQPQSNLPGLEEAAKKRKPRVGEIAGGGAEGGGAGPGGGGGTMGAGGSRSGIISASEVMALPEDELSRVLKDAGMHVKEEWDRLKEWEAELGQRATAVQKQEATLADWKQELASAAQVVNASFAELERRLRAEQEAQSQAKRDRVLMMAKTVRQMDAREAAKLFVTMQEDLAYNVLSELNDRTRGAIFNEINRTDPKAGTRLMTLMSRTRREALVGPSAAP